MNRKDCLSTLLKFRDEKAVVVSTMGSAAPWAQLSQSVLDFPSVNSAMGHAADFAMGIALAQPQRSVWCLNGDGSMLMNLGTLVTICQTPAANLVLFVLQNDTFEITGNQPIPGAGKIDFCLLAEASGFRQVHEFSDVKSLESGLPEVLAQPGPVFVNLRIEKGNELPPKLDGPLRIPAHELRAALVRD